MHRRRYGVLINMRGLIAFMSMLIMPPYTSISQQVCVLCSLYACFADPYIIYALLLLSKRGMKASTRARFATTRLLSAAALGQLLHLGTAYS